MAAFEEKALFLKREIKAGKIKIRFANTQHSQGQDTHKQGIRDFKNHKMRNSTNRNHDLKAEYVSLCTQTYLYF